MSDSESNPDAAPSLQGAGPERRNRAFERRGFKIFGLGLQDFIRIFFGGNASLAIVVLILICVFLAREAAMFFPDHHEGLKSYRQSGQEFVDFLNEEHEAQKNVYGAANVAYFAEVNRTSREEDAILRAYRAVLANVENLSPKEWKRLDRAIEELDDIEDGIEDIEPGEAGSAETLAELESARRSLEKAIGTLRRALSSKIAEVIETEEAWDLGVGTEQPPAAAKPKIREAVLFAASPGQKDEHSYIEELKNTSRERKAAAAAELEDWKSTLSAMRDSAKPLDGLIRELREAATENKKRLTSFSTAADRKRAWEEGAANTTDPAEKARMLAEAEKVVIEEPDYDAMNRIFYDAVPEHASVAAAFEIEMERLYSQLPKASDVKTKSAREKLGHAQVYYERFEDRIEGNRAKAKEWRHDTPLGVGESISAFLFGRNWITNSSWHDFYGLLPLFAGSFLIALIALTVAVPFSICAAIYVNQLAPRREQNLIKPTIEFIGAIPSVVLGFFGILVFGETLREISQLEWLSWVPGFPMAERLNILTAGLLLAFMAVPTIFTLTEDALNNVPQAFSENSLALGATKLQTVIRVVVPTAVSGIIAAVLLGFGRIIGETMVVLLVAGNKIKIPDLSLGIGVVTEPAHTMTGIIAQELGEVDHGSLHWRALFMVGMVLFFLSLTFNFAAQRALKRFQKV